MEEIIKNYCTIIEYTEVQSNEYTVNTNPNLLVYLNKNNVDISAFGDMEANIHTFTSPEKLEMFFKSLQ